MCIQLWEYIHANDNNNGSRENEGRHHQAVFTEIPTEKEIKIPASSLNTYL